MFQRFITTAAIATAALALMCPSPFATAPDAYEPNDSPGAATGPLIGGLAYKGGIHSATDRDYFYLYTAGPGTYNVQIVDYGDPWYGCQKDCSALSSSGDLLDY